MHLVTLKNKKASQNKVL